jgi:hypothetical protein
MRHAQFETQRRRDANIEPLPRRKQCTGKMTADAAILDVSSKYMCAVLKTVREKPGKPSQCVENLRRERDRAGNFSGKKME